MTYGQELLRKDRLDEMLRRERQKKKHNSSCYYCGVLQDHADDCPKKEKVSDESERNIYIRVSSNI